ncbi:MAG: AAA family ATPase [Anaerolineae bacterium]|nr:AAA family ATPase [Anaerolineae bacterium]
MMTALDRMRVSGFKSIRELDLELRALNVLIGANGAGKSNFIQVFSLLNAMIDERLQNFVARAGGANNLLYFGRKTTEEIRVSLSFGQGGYHARLTATDDDKLFYERAGFWFHSENFPKPIRVPFGSGYSEMPLKQMSSSDEGHIASRFYRQMQDWKLYQFHDTSASAKIKQTGDIGDNEFLRSDAGNLAAFLYMLQESHPTHYDQIVRTIRLVAPFFDTFNLRPSPFNREKIRLEWREVGSDDYFNASMLSDGTLRFMCMVTLLLQPDLPATILIDEPELGLHPYALTLLAGLLRSAAAKTQVIVATQSVPLVNQFTPEDVIVVDRVDNASEFRRLDQADYEMWLDDYGLGDLWEKNVIGGRPRR